VTPAHPSSGGCSLLAQIQGAAQMTRTSISVGGGEPLAAVVAPATVTVHPVGVPDVGVGALSWTLGTATVTSAGFE
jgi:hypothetical protein